MGEISNTLTVMNSNHFANQGLLLLITVDQNGLDQNFACSSQDHDGGIETIVPIML